MVVTLTEDEVGEAKSLGTETHERFRGQHGHYRNLLRNHLLGKLSEVGVEKFLRSQGLDPDPAYRDPARVREPDLGVDGNGIEVKTWRPDTWDQWGRCVTSAQAPGVAKKARAVVWTITDDEAEPVSVTIAGWSTPQDILSTEPRATGPSYRPIVNHQVALADIRDLAGLLALLSGSGE